jgi:uncharacterized protein YraI
MKNSRYAYLLMLIGGLTALSPGLRSEGMPGTVKASRLNVRIRPAVEAPVVCTLNFGARLKILGRQGEWYQIAVPGSCPVWLAAEQVKEGQILAETPLRMGPGPDYESYGSLPAGKKIRILNNFEEQWLKIEAPPDINVWVAAEYVAVEEKSAGAMTRSGREATGGEMSPEAAKPSPAYATRYLSGTPPPSAPSGQRVVQLKQSGDRQHLAAEGVIFPLQTPSSQVTHGLVWSIDRQYYPICYLYSDTFQLNKIEFKKVRVAGELKRVSGWSRPALNVRNITILPW